MASYLYSGTTGGNWSASANWTDMTTGLPLASPNLPTSIDDVYLHNKTVIIDSGVTVNVKKISNRATTGFTVNANAGGTAQITITNTYAPTVTVGSGGIESSQATTAGNTITISGSPTSQANVTQILCNGGLTNGDITGGSGAAGTSHGIYITASNAKIYILAKDINSGTSTTSDAIRVAATATGNTIAINASGGIYGGTAPSITFVATSGSLYIKAATISAGNSVSSIAITGISSSTHYIGYSYDFSTSTPSIQPITNITASGTYPAIYSLVTTPLFIQATNINGDNNGILPIISLNAKIAATNIKLYNPVGSLITYQNQTPSATTVTEASIWSYATRELTSAKNITTDDTKINSTAIKIATDRIPTNPASVQSTGDQIATLQ